MQKSAILALCVVPALCLAACSTEEQNNDQAREFVHPALGAYERGEDPLADAKAIADAKASSEVGDASESNQEGDGGFNPLGELEYQLGLSEPLPEDYIKNRKRP